MHIVIKPSGIFIGIYYDSFDYGVLGRPQIRRASHVEPADNGQWTADMTPVDGPVLGPFDKRREALDAELEFLNMLLSDSESLDEHLVS